MYDHKREAMLIEHRKRELLRQAKLHALMREARRNPHQRGARLLLLLADLMIENGQRLKSRYTPKQVVHSRS